MRNTFKVRKISAAALELDHKYLALGLAFVICLLLAAGIKAASATGPNMSPPSGSVVPNFSGLSISGNSTFDGGMDVHYPLKNNIGADTPVLIEDNLQVDGNSDLKGDTSVTGNMSVTGEIKAKKVYNPENLPTRKYDFTGVSAGGGICKVSVKWNATTMYTQNVTDTGGDGAEKVSTTVDGDLVVTVVSFPSCSVSPTSQTVDRSNLNIADSSSLTGNLSIGGDLAVAGNIIGLQIPAQSNVFDTLTVNTSLDLKGSLSDSGGKVTVSDADGMEFSTVKDVDSSGTATLRFGTGLSWLGIDNNEIAAYGDKLFLQGSGATTDVSVGTDLDLGGALKSSTGAVVVSDASGMKLTGSADVKPSGEALIHLGDDSAWMGIDKNEVASYGDTLYFQNDSDQNVQIGNATHNSDAQIYGKLKAKQIGKYTKNASSTYKTLSNNADGQHTATCPYGSIALSCGFVPFTNTSGNEYQGPNFFVSGFTAKMDEGSCVGHFVNKTGSTKYVKVYAVCFDPNSN